MAADKKNLAEVLQKMNRLMLDCADECEKVCPDDNAVGAGFVVLGLQYLIAAQIHNKFESARQILENDSP